MRIMAGLSRPSAGAANVADQARVGYLGHATFLYPGLTAVENLAFWRDAYGLKLTRDDIMAGLARVGLEAHAHERAGVFSRGMAQRLNLARVLMQAPDVTRRHWPVLHRENGNHLGFLFPQWHSTQSLRKYTQAEIGSLLFLSQSKPYFCARDTAVR